MKYETILFEKIDRVARITLNRPEVLNAISSQMLLDLRTCAKLIHEQDDIGALIIRGAGRAFSSGADLKEWAKISKSLSETAGVPYYSTLSQEVYSFIDELSKPVIAEINGYCLGGGFELMLTCDFRFASMKSNIGAPEINLGAFPGGGGGTQRLPRQIGYLKAMELLLCGELVNAKDAERIGLINKALPGSQLEKYVLDFAAKIASRSPVCLQYTKLAVKKGLEMDLPSALQFETLLDATVMRSPDASAGIKKFLQKEE